MIQFSRHTSTCKWYCDKNESHYREYKVYKVSLCTQFQVQNVFSFMLVKPSENPAITENALFLMLDMNKLQTEQFSHLTNFFPPFEMMSQSNDDMAC